MPKKNRDEDEDEDEEKKDPFNFFKFFEDPNKFFKDSNIFQSKQFQHMFKDIFEKIKKNLPSELRNLSPEEIMKEFTKNKNKFGFPITYGFNINIGPEGPTIDSFGNVKAKPYSGEPEVKKVREPLTEVTEQDDYIIVICEMPGITRDEIELKATTRSLTISTETKDIGRNYHRNKIKMMLVFQDLLY